MGNSRIVKSHALNGEGGTGSEVGSRPKIDLHPFDARAEAERILEAAKIEAERLRTQAQHEGRERGLAAATEMLTAARAAAVRTQRTAETELRMLSVRIAERILGRELSLSQDAVVDIVAEALRYSGGTKEILLRVHPDDLKALERGRPRLLERCAQAAAVQFRPDHAIGRGGCIVETELGTVDARLPIQLQAIERALLGAAAHEG